VILQIVGKADQELVAYGDGRKRKKKRKNEKKETVERSLGVLSFY